MDLLLLDICMMLNGIHRLQEIKENEDYIFQDTYLPTYLPSYLAIYP